MAEEPENQENLPQPEPFPDRLTEDPETKIVAHQVREYLWGKGPYEHRNVSAQMKRDAVLLSVDFEMPSLPPASFWRVRVLADLYYLRDLLPKFSSYLNRQESGPNDLDRTIANTIILSEIGDESYKNTALQYYNYLVGHPHANEKFAELIECLAVLGNRAQPTPLKTRMEHETRSLGGRVSAEPEQGAEKRAIEDLANNEFFYIEESNNSRQRINAISDTDKRLRELIKVYLLQTDDGGGEYFELWVQQQIRRIAEATGNAHVIEALRAVLTAMGGGGEVGTKFCRIRTFNAIEFFIGQLTADEASFMEKNRKNQIDPLRYIPVGAHYEPVETEEDGEDEEETQEDENDESQDQK